MTRQIVRASAAVRRPFNLFLYGQTKGGKTTGAWLAAMRLCDRLAVGYDKILFIDTEAGRSTYILDTYPQLADAGIVYWSPPFSVPELTRFLRDNQSKYAVIVLDTLSAFYSREGGTLDEVGKETVKNQGNSYVAWRVPGKDYGDLLTTLTQLSAHVIVTARAKMEYEQQEVEKNGRKKKVVAALGVGPIVRASETAYEFDLEVEVVLDGGDRLAIVRGSRVGNILAGQTYKGGFDPVLVDEFLNVMDTHRGAVPVAPLSISNDDFLAAWKEVYPDTGVARAKLNAEGGWTVLKNDGERLARILADAQAEQAQAEEDDAVEDAPENELGASRPNGE